MSASIRGHSPGAYLLVLTEVLERFSYYGMRGLLVLFMTSSIASGGLAWPAKTALGFYGGFTALIWMAPVMGGWIGDRWLGQRKAVFVGGILMGLGHLGLVAATFAPQLLAVDAHSLLPISPEAALGHWNFEATTAALQHAPGLANGDVTALRNAVIRVAIFFLGGLALIVVGNGLLKPNITIMLGRLYPLNDPRRETAFTLFYVGVSLGAFLSALGAGTAGELIGWRYGFALCSAVMLGGIFYYALRAPILLGAVSHADPGFALSAESPRPRHPIVFIALLSLFAVVFWIGYEQSGGLLSLYTYQKVDRTVLGLTVPATWILSLLPVFTILFGVGVAGVLFRVANRGIALDAPRRFALGLLVGAAAFALLGAAMWRSEAAGQLLGLHWMIVFYFLLMVAELVLSPAGFAMVSRYAPPRLGGAVMGLWLLSVAIGSAIAGQVGAYGTARPPHVTFLTLALAFALTAGVLLLARPRLLRLIDPVEPPVSRG